MFDILLRLPVSFARFLLLRVPVLPAVLHSGLLAFACCFFALCSFFVRGGCLPLLLFFLAVFCCLPRATGDCLQAVLAAFLPH